MVPLPVFRHWAMLFNGVASTRSNSTLLIDDVGGAGAGATHGRAMSDAALVALNDL